ncbi:MAG TPA: HAD-IA family hydrolase, partial [Polyangiaceae bacterium]|nr:HAD-IA family hydrolase [Polyangiaceae bacterium]
MSANGKIDLVCFDIGGVLVRILTAWPDLCRAMRIDVRGESAGELAENARRELAEAYQRGDLSTEAWMAAVENALSGLYTADELATLHDAVLIEEYPGVAILIDELHRAGIATACLSNTNELHWPKLVHHDGARVMPGEPRYPGVHKLGSHHASHLMKFIKPAPDIYRAFEKATGRSGSQILFFDDLAENVAAAKSLGWHAERIDPTAPTG